jgi:hypothetical protein
MNSAKNFTKSLLESGHEHSSYNYTGYPPMKGIKHSKYFTLASSCIKNCTREVTLYVILPGDREKSLLL